MSRKQSRHFTSVCPNLDGEARPTPASMWMLAPRGGTRVTGKREHTVNCSPFF